MVDSSVNGNFLTDNSEVDILIAKLKLPPPPSTIDPDQIKDPPFDDHFACVICLNVVMEPKECQSCDKLICSTCWE